MDESDLSSSSTSSSDSSYDTEDSSSSSQGAFQYPNELSDDCGGSCTAQVKKWTKQVPIGMGLCPWAVKSNNLGRIKYVSCDSHSPGEVTSMVIHEAKLLCNYDDSQSHDNENNERDQLPLRTTLVICPNISEWNAEFTSFEKYVKGLSTHSNNEATQSDNGVDDRSILQQVTLVAFHPQFLQWRGLPEGLTVGSKVRCHRSVFGTNTKSSELYAATILEVNSRPFGRRRVKVRYDQNELILEDRKEQNQRSKRKNDQYIPTDWVVPADGNIDDSICRIALPDNMMHRAPHPTIHIINNQDLYSMCARDISRLKRKNAQLMTVKFG